MILSILIPTLTERGHLLERLLNRLEPQCTGLEDQVEILVMGDNRQMTTGSKRNSLVSHAKGLYCSFVDDDDDVAMDYVEQLIAGAKNTPDCITFQGNIISGNFTSLFDFRIGYPYDSKAQQINGKRTYRRPPNHLCAIRTEIMKQYPFPDKVRFEDYEQCLQMAKDEALKTEHHINKVLYYYFYTKKKGDKSYGE